LRALGEGSIRILPGQYADRETGLHYNYFRDYDPQTGRYVQSDPVGLRGGINSYLYVHARPLDLRDPLGLLASGGCCNPLSDDECCAKAAAAALFVVGGAEVEGIAICCQGRKVGCANVAGRSRGSGVIRKCVLAHERKHFEHIDCRAGCGVFHPEFKAGIDPRAGECEAYGVELACLRDSMVDCKNEEACKIAVEAAVRARIRSSGSNYGCRW